MCESFKTLDFSYCTGITATALGNVLLPQCVRLEELSLSGITSLDDKFIETLCRCCPSLQKVRWVVGGGGWLVGCGWSVVGGLWTVDCGLWTVDCGLWTVDCGLCVVLQLLTCHCHCHRT